MKITSKKLTYTFLIMALIFSIIFHFLNASYPVDIKHEGNSEEFKNTQILLTLYDKIDQNKNLIWCPSFQIAWNELKKYFKNDINLNFTNEIIKNLNNSIDYKSILPVNSFYIFNGIANSDNISKIHNDIVSQFNTSLTLPEINNLQSNSLLLLTYLSLKNKFSKDYHQNDKPMIFNSNTDTSEINTFGILETDEYKFFDLRDQIKPIYFKYNFFSKTFNELIIDPDFNESKEIQLIIALTELKENLNLTVNHVLDKLNTSLMKPPKDEYIDYSAEVYLYSFGASDSLLIPDIYFKIRHNIKSIENIGLNNNFNINKAIQIINFKLDRKGVDLSSEAQIDVACRGICFKFDRPFLIILKSRNSKIPLFVLWIANSELLSNFNSNH